MFEAQGAEEEGASNEATHRASPSVACQSAGAPVVVEVVKVAGGRSSPSRTLRGPETGMQPPVAAAPAAAPAPAAPALASLLALAKGEENGEAEVEA